MLNKSSACFNFLLFVFLFCSAISYAQKNKKPGLWKALNTPAGADTTAEDYYGNAAIRYEDYVYKPGIKSVQLHEESFEMSQPILKMDSEEKLKLSFDDLDAGLKNYTYTFIHCSAGWEPSDLAPAEFIDGFPENQISDHAYSYNTIQHFIHYSFVFPNENLRFTKSGNYILKVIQDGKADNIVLTRRFMVYQDKVNITAKVTPASITEYRAFKQELDFTVNHSGYVITNPYEDLKIVMMQNNRWDNAKTNLKPLFVKDDELVYDYDDANVFDGGNEFRYFDMKSIRYHSEKIADVFKDSLGYHVTLLTDEKRTFKRYSTYTDINGNYLIKVQEGTNSEVEAEYCYVNFFLDYNAVLTDGNLYLYGSYNAWKCNQENLMHYNQKRGGYECTLYLKQGYYNYEYVFLKDGTTAADQTLIEGMHYETENDYTIYVYHHQQGTFYDQLIGLKRLNSIK